MAVFDEGRNKRIIRGRLCGVAPPTMRRSAH